MIEVKGLNKSFNGKQVLSDINVTFQTGKVNLIIGKSGSGKTVLLKSLISLHTIDSGSIFFDGTNVVGMPLRELKKLRETIGVVFQGGALFDSQTVLENIMFPLNIFTSLSKSEKIEKAINVLHKVNLVNVENLYPSEISGGMKKRVAIARAIVMKPKYLFCDEPNSGLDPVTSIVIDNLIQELTSEYQMTTVVNTHDMNSVFEIGENILFINEGKQAWEGSSKDIINSGVKCLDDFLFASSIIRKLKK